MANMKLIEAKTVGSGGIASIEFAAIPNTYTDLYILCSLRSSISAGADDIYIQLNNSASNFSWKNLLGTGTTVISQNNSNNQIGSIPATIIANTFGNASIYIGNYAGSSNKFLSGDSSVENVGTTGYNALYSTLWSNSAAITSVKLLPSSGTFLEFSTAYLYGISNTIASGAKATGGYVTEDTNYFYHTFLSSGVFRPTANLTCDYLVVAGGGAGGPAYYGGGGGAGGLRSTVTATGGGGALESALSLTANTNYTVTIGAGGAGGTDAYTSRGNAGSNSEFSTITSTGGGGGGTFNTAGQINGGDGGSSGGGGNGNGVAGTRTASPVQGYNGGNASFSLNVYSAGGGGGGAGSAGANSTTSPQKGGNGGNGVQITTFANATVTGFDNGYYAGGGGGGLGLDSGVLGGTSGTGGLGGAGAGSTNGFAGFSAFANTGSGGGGAGGYANKNGSGGSGIVIVRYAK